MIPPTNSIKSVQFDETEPTTWVYSKVPLEYRDRVWYDSTELKFLLITERKSNNARENLLQTINSNADFETSSCSMRGLEMYGLESRVLERKKYIKFVLLYQADQIDSKDKDPGELRKAARSLSRAERQRAHLMGLQDEAIIRRLPMSNRAGTLSGNSHRGSNSSRSDSCTSCSEANNRPSRKQDGTAATTTKSNHTTVIRTLSGGMKWLGKSTKRRHQPPSRSVSISNQRDRDYTLIINRL